MRPHLFYIPVVLLVALFGGLLGASILSSFYSGSGSASGSEKKHSWVAWLGAVVGAAGAGLFAYNSPSWGGQNSIPVQGYGVMILLGVICGMLMAAWRSRQLGVEPKQCVDIGIFGVCIGLLGSRLFHIVLNWSDFNPLTHGLYGVIRMFKIWEGGLVFYGAFMTVLPATWWYCKRHGIAPIPFLDLSVPGLIAGQAFGRIGCFLNGCCFGKSCSLPWAVQFPPGSPAATAFSPSPFLHPTQLYASLAAALTAAFLYAYWPHRRYDGQILSLMLIMAGTTRFFEESLRADDVAAFPALSSWMTIAQWLAIPIALSGLVLLIYFRNRQTCFKPPALSVN